MTSRDDDHRTDARDDSEVTLEHLENLDVEDVDDSEVWLLARIPEWLGAVVVVALTLAVTYAVVMRALGHGVTGVVEGAGLAMVIIVLLGMSALALRNGHVRIELIDPLLDSAGLKVVNLVSTAVQMVVAAVLVYAMFETFSTDLARGTTIGTQVPYPRMYVSGLATVCFVILEISLVRRLVREIHSKHESVMTRKPRPSSDVTADAAPDATGAEEGR